MRRLSPLQNLQLQFFDHFNFKIHSHFRQEGFGQTAGLRPQARNGLRACALSVRRPVSQPGPSLSA